MDHPYNHYRKHKPDCDLQRYNKLKCHTSPGMDLYNVRWCMLGLPDTQTVVYILVDSLVRVRYSLANKSIQLSNQPHGTVSMGRKDLVHISVFQAQCIMVVLRFNFCFMQFSEKNVFCTKERKKDGKKKKKCKTYNIMLLVKYQKQKRTTAFTRLHCVWIALFGIQSTLNTDDLPNRRDLITFNANKTFRCL